jgi:hypothetical protein
MENVFSSETNSCSAAQKIPRLLWNPKFRYLFANVYHWFLSSARLICVLFNDVAIYPGYTVELFDDIRQ